MKVLITGSTQGIGMSLARAFVRQGDEVTVHCSRDREKAERIRREIGAAHAVTADLSDERAADSLYALTGDVDALIVNASVQYKRPWYEITTEEFDTQVCVNFKSTLRLMQLYYPKMKENAFGRIVTVGSVQQYRPHKDMAVYAATKCAVMSLVANIAKQVAPYGITVNNVSPGVIATPRNEDSLNDADYRAKVLAGIPMGYAGNSDDINGTVLMLCSDGGRYITGTDIVVDGGMHL